MRPEQHRRMNLFTIVTAMSIAGAPTPAVPDTRPLELTPKAAVIAAPHSSAPFVTPSEPRLRLPERSESRPESNPSACESDRALCYDAGHIVFKPARRFLPEIPGLQRENISLKRDRIIFRYSF
jgi:hypothetical protein